MTRSGGGARMGTGEQVLGWDRTELLPGPARRLLAGFAALAPAGPSARPALRVEVSDRYLPVGYEGLGVRPPSAGPMAGLPLVPAVTMDAWPDLLLWTWRGAGMLAGRSGSGRAIFHPAQAVHPEQTGQTEQTGEQTGEQTTWMVAQLTGTVLHLIGATIPVHGTTLRLADRTLMLMGGSGSGKTTLALILALGGARVLAEDFTYLDAHGRAMNLSIRPHLTLRRGTWQALRSRLRQWWDDPDGWSGELDASTAFEQSRTGQVRLPIRPIQAPESTPVIGPVDAILLPRMVPGLAGFRIVRMEAPDLVTVWRSALEPRMLRWPLPFLTNAGYRPAELRPLPVPVLGVDLGLDYGERLDELRAGLLASLDEAVGRPASTRPAPPAIMKLPS